MNLRASTFSGGTTLILGGGGARGYAHFGVLQVLQESGFEIDRVVGVSIGAFIGALYCETPNAHAITERVHDYVHNEKFLRYYNRMLRASQGAGHTPDDRDGETNDSAKAWGRIVGRVRGYLRATVAFHRFVSRPGILSNRPMEDCLESLLENSDIADLKVPLTIVATDLKIGERLDMEVGDLFSAIIGSTALPGIFPPVERGDHLLSDYGVLCSIPMESAQRHRPDLVVAVDLSPKIETKDKFDSGLDVINRMDSIGCQLFNNQASTAADLVIRPDLGQTSWADFLNMEEIVEAGRQAALDALPHLESLVSLPMIQPHDS